jgi:hypothetical protein
MSYAETYRGYRITVKPWHFAWQMQVNPRKAGLPILSYPAFRWAGLQREALMEARGRVDDLLGGPGLGGRPKLTPVNTARLT